MSDAKTEAMKKLDEVLAKLDWLAGKVDALAASRPAAAPARVAASGEAVFPPYGNSKGQPVRGADLKTLEFYAGGCRRSLGDESKSRWHDKERTLLAAIEAEIARQSGGDGPPPHTDADVPPEELPF
jgi:hypothetical protein